LREGSQMQPDSQDTFISLYELIKTFENKPARFEPIGMTAHMAYGRSGYSRIRESFLSLVDNKELPAFHNEAKVIIDSRYESSTECEQKFFIEKYIIEHSIDEEDIFISFNDIKELYQRKNKIFPEELFTKSFGSKLDYMRVPLQEHKKDKTQETASSWEGITLTLLAKNLIECSFDNTKFKRSLEEIGLAKQGNQELTKPGGVLLRLSRRAKYPINKAPADSEKKDISKIRDALKKLCGLTDDPFLLINPADGYKLKCKLIDNTKLSDLREKDRAIHVPLDDDTRPYEEEPDPSGGWLKKHDK